MDTMSEYKTTIGLEVHAELKTRTKMFCNSANDSEAKDPNTNICPVCMAHPGTLPVINKQAVEHVLRVGCALGSRLADYTEFDRKSYFYPDIPKSYQISQYEFPLVSGGSLAGVEITRVHLEEDTARSSHEGNASLVDFNRAGVPLMELVTEPVIHDAKTAGDFARELQLLLRTLDVSDANLEKGEMRVEANVSVSKDGTMANKYVEIKNINSFRSVEKAIAYEVERQIARIESGEAVIQETRGWDETKQRTFSQRVKEGSADYRYFPEPDLPKMVLSEVADWSQEVLQKGLPELPWEKRARYEEVGLKPEDAISLTMAPLKANFFDTMLERFDGDTKRIVIASNYLINDVGEAEPPSLSSFVELIEMIADGSISSRGAKDILKVLLVEKDTSPKVIASREGLLQQSDPEVLSAIVRAILKDKPDKVAEYKAGKASVLQFFVGQSMSATKGSGNPILLQEIVLKELSQ